jgi:lipoprotein-releasing system permease protein
MELIRPKVKNFSVEYEIELLLKNRQVLSPVILHGIATNLWLPDFLQGWDGEGVLLPWDLANKLGIAPHDQIKLISPSHVDHLMGDLPRYFTAKVADRLIETKVPEVDIVHVWVRLEAIWNLIQKKGVNKIRIFGDIDVNALKDLLSSHPSVKFHTWEEKNQSLVWALKLETTVMIFLFVAMTLLVSLCITTGLLIFFDKIKIDLASFWILGSSKKQLLRASVIFLHLLSFCSVSLGLLAGAIFLFFFHKYGGEIMPAIFVERKIPVFVNFKAISIAFCVPYLISLIFSHFSLKQLENKEGLLDNVRVVG